MDDKVSESLESTQFLLPKIPNISNKRFTNVSRSSFKSNGSSDSGAETSDSDDKVSSIVDIIYQCCGCSFVSNEISLYVHHMKTIHDTNSIQCMNCGQNMSLDIFQRHLSKCKGSYFCEYCEASFAQKSYLQRHISRIHLKSHSKFLCDICGQVLSSNTNLKQHKLIHSDNIRFKCEFCNKGFFQKIHYNTHLDSKHSKIELANVKKPFICYVCSERFLFHTSLQQHLNHYCCKKEKRYVCSSCNKAFFYPSELKRHAEVHLGKYDRLYSCPLCDKSYNRLYRFVEHQFFHQNASAFKCQKCGKLLSDLSYLKQHYKRHFVVNPNGASSNHQKFDAIVESDMNGIGVDECTKYDNNSIIYMEDDDNTALIDNFIEEIWDRFQPYLTDDTTQTISFDDLKIDIWEEFCND